MNLSRRPPSAGPLAGIVVLVLLAGPVSAQTVRPVIVEYKEKAKARFEIVNETLFPLNAVLEPFSFDVSETGEPAFRPLDGGVHLQLSSMSFRIPPRGSSFVFYEAKAERLPAWFVIYCTFAGFPSQSGLTVQVQLPHTVYLLQKKPLRKSDVEVRALEYDVTNHRVRVELENMSPNLGRVLAAEILAHRQRKSLGSFPLLPESRRRLETEWTAPTPPEKVVLRFRGFKIEEPLVARNK